MTDAMTGSYKKEIQEGDLATKLEPDVVGERGLAIRFANQPQFTELVDFSKNYLL